MKSESIDPRDCVLYYHVSIMIQDGYEKMGEFPTREEAVNKYIQAQALLNGSKDWQIADVPVYAVERVPMMMHTYKKI